MQTPLQFVHFDPSCNETNHYKRWIGVREQQSQTIESDQDGFESDTVYCYWQLYGGRDVWGTAGWRSKACSSITRWGDINACVEMVILRLDLRALS